MTTIVYLNGAYLAKEEAKISVFDRGFLFADAVYEITAVLGGKLVDFENHMTRLKRSLNELKMAMPLPIDEVRQIHLALIQKNAITDGLVYYQVTRGIAERDFAFPPDGTSQSVVMFTQSKPGIAEIPIERLAIKVKTLPDLRWARRDIKTVQLLYPSLAKMEAKGAGFDDAWLLADGIVTEGTSNNAYIVTGDRIVTRNLGSEILPGITRTAVLEYARQTGMTVEERPFSVDEAYAADEAFITSATSFVTPVVQIDDLVLGDGRPGPVATRLRAVYLQECRNRS